MLQSRKESSYPDIRKTNPTIVILNLHATGISNVLGSFFINLKCLAKLLFLEAIESDENKTVS